MQWWVWLLIAWVVIAAIAAFVLGLALANAEVQDAARRLVEDKSVGPADKDLDPDASEPPRDVTADGAGPTIPAWRHGRRRSRPRRQ
jgi:hypothetical protein